MAVCVDVFLIFNRRARSLKTAPPILPEWDCDALGACHLEKLFVLL